MSAPRGVLDAIAKVSPVACSRCGVAEVAYSERDDRPEIRHVYADCPYVTEVDSPAAIALALSVDMELARHVRLADYGEPAVVHVWAMT